MKEKRFAFWGAGEMCRNLLKENQDFKPEYIIDSDRGKTGTCLWDIKIVPPEILLEDKNIFIIVTSQYEKEIFGQLKDMGLIFGVDYIGIHNLYKQGVPMEAIQGALEEEHFQIHLAQSEIIKRVNSMEEYKAFLEENLNGISYEKSLARIYYRMPGKMGSYRGYCEACNEERDFQVDFYWSESREPAWRETLTCPDCMCNSRMRFVIGYLKKHHKEKRVYCYEAKTVLYKQLQSCIERLVGSEYFGDNMAGGTMVDGTMHQDATNLSFQDAAFDVMVSCDVFEHVSDYKMALKEANRCLAPGGELIVSIPVFKDRYANVTRTEKNKEGELLHFLPPIYHGNPLSSEGSLVFQEFGWQFLDDLKQAGFRKAWALVYFSVSKGYLGELPIIFIARK